MVRTSRLILLAASAFVLTAGSAAASGGGGGGTGDMPSVSGPLYDPVAEYEKAVEAMRVGNYKAAAEAYKHVTMEAPQASEGWYGLGRAKSELGDLKGARKAFEKAVKVAPNDVANHAQLGATLAKMNETDKAQAELDLLKQKAGACADACPDAESLKIGIGIIESALTPAATDPAAAPAAAAPAAAPTPSASLDLLFVDPSQGDASYSQALALVNEKRYGEALAALSKAEKAFGAHPDVLTYMGYVHRRMGELAAAETYYRQALAIAPNHRGALEYYGELKVVKGDISGAKTLLAQLDRICAYDCAEAEELRRWIDAGAEPR